MLSLPPKKFPCGIRGCGNFFGNKGALQTHTLIKHQGQRPVGQSGIKFGNGASAQKFPVPFWKVCAAFDLLAIGHLRMFPFLFSKCCEQGEAARVMLLPTPSIAPRRRNSICFVFSGAMSKITDAYLRVNTVHQKDLPSKKPQN